MHFIQNTMKQQIVIIHGGNTFQTYEEYLEFLKQRPLDLERLRPHPEWKDSLTLQLGDNFDVLLPRMPNGANAQYSEWKIWLEKILALLDDSTIFIGHSLGGVFLAKYFSENDYAKKIRAAILIAAPFDNASIDEKLASFALNLPLDNFRRQCKNIYLIHSLDDPLVPFEQIKKYKKALPAAKELIFSDRKHFICESFPEIIDLVKKIAQPSQ